MLLCVTWRSPRARRGPAAPPSASSGPSDNNKTDINNHDMCVYIYIYIYKHIHTYIYCIYIYIIIYRYRERDIHMYMYIYIYIYHYMHIHTYVYIYVYVYMYAYIRELGMDRQVELQDPLPLLPGEDRRLRKRRAGLVRRYGQFSEFQICFCGLDPGNLKSETVRTDKRHVCFQDLRRSI